MLGLSLVVSAATVKLRKVRSMKGSFLTVRVSQRSRSDITLRSFVFKLGGWEWGISMPCLGLRVTVQEHVCRGEI